MDWLSIAGAALGVAGAIAFLLAYGDRQRLKGTIESYQNTVSAYKEELAVTKAEKVALLEKVNQCQGAIQVLTESVTQSAKVDMLAHNNADQHRLLMMKLEEIRLQFAPITAAVLGKLRDGMKGPVIDGPDSSVNS